MDVWVSVDNPWGEPHGTRPFHREGCSHIRDLKYWKAMPKAKAERQGREPCTRCKP